MQNNIEDAVYAVKKTVTEGIKKWIYDIVASVIIVVIVIASLGIFDLVEFDKDNFWSSISKFLIEWIPYFMATLLLNNNRYQKGTFVGKSTKKYQDMAKFYTKVVDSLSGERIKNLDQFCDEYNESCLKNIRTSILKEVSICYEDYDKEFMFDKDGEKIKHKPLKICDKESLVADGYTTIQVNAIMKAQKVKIKGLKGNELLSSITYKDPTDLGKNEGQLNRQQVLETAVKNVVSTLLLFFVAIKDITTWGWAGVFTVLIKVCFVVAMSFANYFRGYNDITIKIVNHLARKTDVLKTYIKYVPVTTDNSIEITNDVENKEIIIDVNNPISNDSNNLSYNE